MCKQNFHALFGSFCPLCPFYSIDRGVPPFFRYIYAVPENARTLLRLAQYRNPELRRMLASVDMQTLELIPGSYSNVKEWGEADLAFKASLKNGPEIFVGILLEHKSYRKIIYNGQKDWDPMAEFRAKFRGEFNGRELPFECVLVNLADIPDSKCFAEKNIEAAVGALVMKYAFDGEKLKGVVKQIVRMLSKMENDARATLVEKIELYLQKTLRLGNGNASISAALGLKVFGRVHRRKRRRGVAYAHEYRTGTGDCYCRRPPPCCGAQRPSSR